MIIDVNSKRSFDDVEYHCWRTYWQLQSLPRAQHLSVIAEDVLRVVAGLWIYICHLHHCKVGSALGESDVPGGWRKDKASGGRVLDIESGETIVDGLSMPHSPRWHDDQLWLLESGRGELITVDLETGTTETVAELPGILTIMTGNVDTRRRRRLKLAHGGASSAAAPWGRRRRDNGFLLSNPAERHRDRRHLRADRGRLQRHIHDDAGA